MVNKFRSFPRPVRFLFVFPKVQDINLKATRKNGSSAQGAFNGDNYFQLSYFPFVSQYSQRHGGVVICSK
jgi:hypothetical protein